MENFPFGNEGSIGKVMTGVELAKELRKTALLLEEFDRDKKFRYSANLNAFAVREEKENQSCK